MANIEFRDREAITRMITATIGALHDTSEQAGDSVVYILAAMPECESNDVPAFLLSTNLSGNGHLLEVLRCLHARLEDHIEKLRRMN